MRAGGLADELGSGQRSAARDAEQRRGERADERGDLAFEFVDAAIELADAVKLLAADRGDEPVQVGEPGGDAFDDVLELEAASGNLQLRRDLVQVPADSGFAGGCVRRRGRRDDRLTAAPGARVRRAGRPGGRAAPGCAGDRERVDRVRLAACRALRRTPAIICVGTRRTCSPARSRSASSVRVTCGQSSIAQRRLGHRPADAIAARCPSVVAAKVLPEFSSQLVRRHECVGVFVRVDADHDPAWPSTWPPLDVTTRRSGGREDMPQSRD